MAKDLFVIRPFYLITFLKGDPTWQHPPNIKKH